MQVGAVGADPVVGALEGQTKKGLYLWVVSGPLGFQFLFVVGRSRYQRVSLTKKSAKGFSGQEPVQSHHTPCFSEGTL